MSHYQVGSLCEDCVNSGLQKHLKLFYINLEEQIIKCESSSCMFPYIRKTIISNSILDANIPENILNLDDFIEENARTLNDTGTQESKTQAIELKVEDIPIMLDFSSLFFDKSIKEENLTQPKPTQMSNPCKQELVTFASIKSEEKTLQYQVPPKARITRCLSNVKNNTKKVSKTKNKKNEPVLVIEPQSGKTMRPLDLIQHYMRNKSGSAK